MYWLVVESTCWINCSSETSHSLEPFCYLNDDGANSRCYIYVSTYALNGLSNNTDWYRIRLGINVTDNITELNIHSGLPDSKLEIFAYRPFNNITRLDLRSHYLIVSISLLIFLPNVKVYIWSMSVSTICHILYILIRSIWIWISIKCQHTRNRICKWISKLGIS